MSITDKSAEADFFCGIFAAIKLSTTKTCVSQKIFVPLHAICVQGAKKNKKLIHKRPKIMASIQDIQALEQKIYDAVQ